MKNKVKIFTSDDRSLKLLGELLGNDTSRKIIRCLIEKQMYTNELAIKLDIPISLVIHHLKKLEELKLVDVKEKQITKKTKKHKFFRMSGKIFVLPNEAEDEIIKTGMLERIFQEKVRYSMVGAAAVLSFISAKIQDPQNAFMGSQPLPQDAAFVPLMILIAGIVIECVIRYKKKKKED